MYRVAIPIEKVGVREKGTQITFTVPAESVVTALGDRSEDLTQEDLTDKASKRKRNRLINIIKKNTSVIVEGERTVEVKEEIKPRFRVVGIVAGVLAATITLSGGLLHSCSQEIIEEPQTKPTQVVETVEFDIHLYDVLNPYVEAWEMVRSKRTRRNDRQLNRRRYIYRQTLFLGGTV